VTISAWTPETQKYQDDEAARQKDIDKKLKQARRMVDKKVDEIKRAVTSIKLWQRRVTYYEREKGVTLNQKRQQREESQRKRAAKRRKIVL
jgi:hypothetical protein